MEDKVLDVNNNSKLPVPGDIFSNEKGQKYQIITIAKHMVTKEKLVIYQALYGDYDVRALPLDRFGGKRKTVSKSESKVENKIEKSEAKADEKKQKTDNVETKTSIMEQCPKGMNELLYAFLEAETVHDRLKLIKDNDNRKYIDDKCIDDMAASIDVTIDDGDIDERIRQLINCLDTMKRFEVLR